MRGTQGERKWDPWISDFFPDNALGQDAVCLHLHVDGTPKRSEQQQWKVTPYSQQVCGAGRWGSGCLALDGCARGALLIIVHW